MSYTVKFSPRALRKLKRMDANNYERLVHWVENHLEGTETPRQYGEALTGDLRGLWRYRVGNYRLVAQIEDDKLIVLMVKIDKHEDIYN